MSKDKNKEQSAVHGMRECKYKPCTTEFRPKKKNQLFCSLGCRENHYKKDKLVKNYELKICKLNTCSKKYMPVISTQEFCSINCKNTYHKEARIKGEAQMNSKGIKYAKIERSERLRRLAHFMADGKEYSTRDIVMGAEIMAVGTAISELRHQLDVLSEFLGFQINGIHCNYKDGHYYYKLIKAVGVQIEQKQWCETENPTEVKEDLDWVGNSQKELF